MKTELKKQKLPQQVHLSQHSQICQQSICRRTMWKELASMLIIIGEQRGKKEAAGMLQQAPCLPSPTLPHIMVMISTTFESPKAKNCSHITEPAVKLSLTYHKMFQTGSKFLEKTQPTKEPVQGEKAINLLLHKQKAKHIHHLLISLYPKGVALHILKDHPKILND